MKKTQVYEAIIWDCPYKKCGHENTTGMLSELKNGRYGAQCSDCGEISEITDVL